MMIMKPKLLLIILLSLAFLVLPVQARQCKAIISVSVSSIAVYPDEYISISGHVDTTYSDKPTVRLYMDNKRVATVKTNADGDYLHNYKISSSMATGPHSIKAVSVAEECYQDYDTVTFTVKQNPLIKFEVFDKEPELKVIDVWASDNLECDEIISIKASIRNEGDITSRDARVSFDVVTDEDTNYIAKRRDISSDDSQTFSFNYHIPEDFDDILIVKATPKDITGSYEFKRDSFDVTCPKEKEYRPEPEEFEVEDDHCLTIDSVSVDEIIRAGEPIGVNIKVSNCGNVKEHVSSRVSTFSRMHYGTLFSLNPGQTKTIGFVLRIPEDAEGQEKFVVRVWNIDVEDSLVRYFTIFNPTIKGKVTETAGETPAKEIIIDCNLVNYISGFLFLLVLVALIIKIFYLADARRRPF